MKTQEFLQKIDESQVVAAIAEAEKRTSGEVRVYVSSRRRDDAMAAAQKRFEKLGMTKTVERNAVLIFIAPLTQKFAIIGDRGIHQKCGDPFWQEVSAHFSAGLKSGCITEALVSTIGKIGDLLAAHFPRADDDRNELPNRIERD